MAKNFKQQGRSITITGQTTTLKQGTIYRRTGQAALGRAWIGVIADEIIGTSADEETIDGRPIQIGDGPASHAQKGDGKGDMDIEGVFTLPLAADSLTVNDGDAIYMNVANTAAPGSVASGVTTNGGVAISGALVGFAVGDHYTSKVAPYTDQVVTDVKLLGLPLHGLSDVGPSA